MTPLDPAAVEALQKAAEAMPAGDWTQSPRTPSRVDTPGGAVSISWFNNQLETPYGPGETAAAFIAAANPQTVLALIAAWRDAQILADQNKVAFNHNADISEALDQEREKVHRLERALLDISQSGTEYANSTVLRLVKKARAALEGSTHRG